MRLLPLVASLVLIAGPGQVPSCPPPDAAQVALQARLDEIADVSVTVLRAACPTDYPVTVRRDALPPDVRGWTVLTPLGYEITISRQIHSPGEMIDVIIHEWAHAMMWPVVLSEDEEHAELWGVAYSRAYRAVEAAGRNGVFFPR